MNTKTTAPYGSWKSPITAALVSGHSKKFGDVAANSESIYWTEMRPNEGGRNVLVRRDAGGTTRDLTAAPFNVRSTVHEYGGGAFTVSGNVVYFVNYDDQRIYQMSKEGVPSPVTVLSMMRYADLTMDKQRERLICVREDHSGEGEAVNTLVSIEMDDLGTGTILVSGADFYASPRLSPDNRHLAWLSWNHPNMPWDGTELWIADIDEQGGLIDRRLIAGGREVSIFRPTWSPAGELYFVSDRSGWWNIYRHSEGRNISICSMEAEFGMPQWVFGMSTFTFLPSGDIICAFRMFGKWRIARLDTRTGQLEPIDQPYDAISGLWGSGERVVFTGASPDKPLSIVELNAATMEFGVVRKSSDVLEDPDCLSYPELVEFPTSGGESAFAYYYAPQNDKYEAAPEELPPLLVISHGGPTGSTAAALNPVIQFWTSRGFAVVDVNYRGSTGYGRSYRERLNGNWGIIDVDDCVNVAHHLVNQGLVDGHRLAIRGGSAGGYTTLAALAFREVFQAGASYFGVSDLEIIVKETHKFESRYIDSLVGPYPEAVELLRTRSPLNHVDKISSPMILFQGLEDRVVLPNQSEMIVEALRKKGIPVAYLPFKGEQHGFRQAKNIARSLEAELYFYSMIFDFQLSEKIEPVEIENL